MSNWPKQGLVLQLHLYDWLQGPDVYWAHEALPHHSHVSERAPKAWSIIVRARSEDTMKLGVQSSQKSFLENYFYINDEFIPTLSELTPCLEPFKILNHFHNFFGIKIFRKIFNIVIFFIVITRAEMYLRTRRTWLGRPCLILICPLRLECAALRGLCTALLTRKSWSSCIR